MNIPSQSSNYTSTPWQDYLVDRTTTNVGQKGFVKLVDVMPGNIPNTVSDEVRCDFAIVQAARVSYGDGTKKTSTDKGLIRYLLRNRHTSPFEMVELKFHIKAPIFVTRQWLRHRTASVNEISARYSVMKDEFHNIDFIRKQSESNKQCSDPNDKSLEDDNEAVNLMNDFNNTTDKSYEIYTKLIEKGVSREVARMHLPVSLMTEFFWKIDLHNLYHFLNLRMDPHAQEEIRDFANAIYDMVKEICPVSSQAFMEYNVNKVTLGTNEIESVRNKSNVLISVDKKPVENKREQAEYSDKLKKLGLEF